MLVAALGLLLLAQSGCGTRSCKSGTFFVTVILGGMATDADSVEAVAALPDGSELRQRFPWPKGGSSGSLEVDFAAYPDGKSVTVRINAFAGAARLATAQTTLTAKPGCSVATVDFSAPIPDGGAGCNPDTDTKCSSDGKSVQTCRSDGSGYDITKCASGCASLSGAPRCQVLQPSGPAEPADSSTATAMATITADTTFDTESGLISGGLTRAAATGLGDGVTFRVASQTGSTVRTGIFGFASLSVMTGATLHFTGKNPVVIVVNGDALLAGNVDLVGDCTMPPTVGSQIGGVWNDANNGNGGGVRGGAVGATNTGAGGGGGGGYGDVGGRGGNGTAAGGGAGGMAFGDLTVADPLLIGGSGGGSGGANAASGAGGKGGGAFQLTANGALTLRGLINAGGCGGRPGAAAGAGGGGGAGGVIFLEATTIQLGTGAFVTVNGGGGGGGDNGMAGGSGSADANHATGGTGGAQGSRGGDGGASGGAQGTNGTDPSGSPRYAGGGGGATGRIGFRTQSGMLTDMGGTTSPVRGETNTSGNPLVSLTRATYQ